MPTTTEGSAGAPAYVRIASALRDRITAGELAPHTLVPSERELSRDSGVSRGTARHALVVLEGEGAIYRRPPRGTFVSEPRLRLRIGSFSDEITRAGRHPTAELLWAETQPATPLVADALRLDPRTPVHALQRLRRADGDPLAIETSYYPAERTPGLLDQPLDGSIWALLREHHGIQPTRAAATVEVITLDEAAAAHLNARATSSGLLLTRHTYDTDDRCFEFARDTYRADRAAFTLDAPIPTPTDTPD